MANNSSTIVTNIIFIIIIAAMIIFMWMSSRKQRKQQQAEADWRQNLKPGEKVATVAGLLGEVVSADPDHDQITIKSGDSISVWRIQAIRRPPVVPKYADEDEDAQDDQGAEGTDSAKDHGHGLGDSAKGAVSVDTAGSDTSDSSSDSSDAAGADDDAEESDPTQVKD